MFPVTLARGGNQQNRGGPIALRDVLPDSRQVCLSRSACPQVASQVLEFNRARVLPLGHFDHTQRGRPFPSLLELGRPGQSLQHSVLLSTFRRVRLAQGAAILGLKGSVFFLSLLVHGQALRLFGIEIPFLPLLAFLPVVFLVGALPVTVAHLGTSQAAWIFFFSRYAPEADLLAYSLVSHLTFMLTNASFGVLFLPMAYRDLFRRGGAGRRLARPDSKTNRV